MKTVVSLLLALFASTAFAQDFADAKILDVQARQGFAPDVTGRAAYADNYTEITIELGDKKYTARSWPMGGGSLYVLTHPEAFIVGSTVSARLAKHGQIEVRTADGKKVKFDIQRIEQL